MTTIGRALCLYMAGHCVFTGPLRVQSANSSQNDQVVDSRHGCAVDPLVDSLRSSEAEHCLHILYSKTGLHTHTVDVLTGCNSVDVRNSYHLHPLSGSITGTGKAGYAALFNFFTVYVLRRFPCGEQALITVIFKNLFHNAALHFPENMQ